MKIVENKIMNEWLVDDTIWDSAPGKPSEPQNEVFKKLSESFLSIKDQYENRYLNIKLKELIQLLTGNYRTSYPVLDLEIRKKLKNHGMIVTRDKFLFIANSNDLLERLIGVKDWNKSLKKIPNSINSPYPKRFGTISRRGLLIPLNFFNN